MENQTFLKKPLEIYEKFRATPGLQARVFRITLLASADANDALRVTFVPYKVYRGSNPLACALVITYLSPTKSQKHMLMY